MGGREFAISANLSTRNYCKGSLNTSKTAVTNEKARATLLSTSKRQGEYRALRATSEKYFPSMPSSTVQPSNFSKKWKN